MSAIAAHTRLAEERHPLWLLGAAAAAWLSLYQVLLPFWDWLLYDVFALPHDAHWADAVHFFLYDSTKILLLLVGIIFAVRVLRSFLSIERTRALLGGKAGREGERLRRHRRLRRHVDTGNRRRRPGADGGPHPRPQLPQGRSRRPARVSRGEERRGRA